MADLKKLYDAVLNGDAKTAVAVTKEAIDGERRPPAADLGHHGPGDGRGGQAVRGGGVLRAGAAPLGTGHEGIAGAAPPAAGRRGAKPTGTVAIGTVKGDLHDIGKNLVASLLEGGGFEVIDLGADVPPRSSSRPSARRGRRSSASRPCSPSRCPR